MKNIALLLSLLAAGTIAPAYAAQFRASEMPPESSLTLEEMLSRNRVSVGASRESVLIELREPNFVIGSDVWVYTGFKAANVFGAERYDTLVLTFKNDKVEVVRLAKEEQVRVAANRSAAGAAKIAKR